MQLSEGMVDYAIEIPNVSENLTKDQAIKSIALNENIMSSALQTMITVQDKIHNDGFVKNIDEYKGKNLEILLKRVGEAYSLPSMRVSNVIYKVGNRKAISKEIEEYTIYATDPSLLSNAAKRVNKSWKCTTPSAIVADVLNGCVEVRDSYVEGSGLPRTYFAENIHPFQVVAQQADAALAGGNDPSFLHFITYENLGSHRFESLRNMTRREKIFEFTHTNRGGASIADTYANPHLMLRWEFPCDFDLLSDLLNAVDADGVDENSLMVFNPFNGIRSMIGAQNRSCGIGGPQVDASFTNKGSAAAEGNCELHVEKYRLKRQARLGMLDADRVALKMVVPFNPLMHVGKMVEVIFPWKDEDRVIRGRDYGSGVYLITQMTHNIFANGYAETVMDLVSRTVGQETV